MFSTTCVFLSVNFPDVSAFQVGLLGVYLMISISGSLVNEFDHVIVIATTRRYLTTFHPTVIDRGNRQT